MLSAELGNELRQAIGRDTVSDNGRPRVLSQHDGRHERDEAIAGKGQRACRDGRDKYVSFQGIVLSLYGECI